MQKLITVVSVLLILGIACTSNSSNDLNRAILQYSNNGIIEYSPESMKIRNLLKQYADENGEESTRSLIGEAYHQKGWVLRPEEIDLLIEYAWNILASCDTNAVLFSDGSASYICNEFVQGVQGYRKDVTVVNRNYLDTQEYLDYLAKETHLSKYPVIFEEMDSTNPGRSIFKACTELAIPCHQTLGCAGIEFPADSSYTIGIVRKYTSPDSIQQSAKKCLEIAKTGEFRFERTNELFYDWSDSMSTFKSVAAAHHYIVSFFNAFYELQHNEDIDTIEKYLLDPLNEIAPKKTNYYLMRFLIAKEHNRPDLPYWKGLIDQNWQEVQKKHPQFAKDYKAENLNGQ